MIWKDRVKQHPHRYRLTNVSGSTYDFEEVTGEVIQQGTPLNAENMNKLALKTSIDGLKPHAFNNLATAQGTQTDVAPSNKLLTESSFARVYRKKTDFTYDNATITFPDFAKLLTVNFTKVAIRLYRPDVPNVKPISTLSGTLFLTRVEQDAVYAKWVSSGRSTTDLKMYNYETYIAPNDSDDRWCGWKRMLSNENISTVMPISSGAASNEKVLSEKAVYDGFATTEYVDNRSSTYDQTIRTQAEFEALIADSTWFGATSVAFVGNGGTLKFSRSDGQGVKVPTNVKEIYGFNVATIDVTDFVHNEDTNRGGLWTTSKCKIDGITVNCTGTGSSFSHGCSGFWGNNNTYSNCFGTGTSNDRGNGFYGNNNTYSNCTGTGTGSGDGNGFYGNNNTYSNCTGTGTGTGTSGGLGYGSGYGFYGNNNRIITCSALAYIVSTGTPLNTNCVPIYNSSTEANLFMIVKDCKFPQIAKSGFRQGTIWCNLSNNTTMVGSVKDNVYHSRFTEPVIAGTKVVQENNQAANITAL